MSSIQVLQKGFPGKADIALLYMSSISFVEHEGKKLLCDLGPISIRKNLIKVMKEKKIDPASIDLILLSHLHHDHAANIDLFPKARVVLSEEEWRYAREGNDQAIQKAYLPLYEEREKVFVTQDGQEILPGLRAWMVPGHTPGSLCFSLTVDGKRWILAGDAVKNRGELRSGEVALTLDPERSRESIARIRSMADIVVPGHDALLYVQGDTVMPAEENVLTLLLPEGMTVNGGNPFVLRVDP